MNTIILSAVTGSQAYGLAREGSDVDMKGVYVAPMDEVLGLDGAHAITESKKMHTDQDSEYHEVAKFLKLLLKCNPTLLEIVYLTEYEVLTPEGQWIRDLRKTFLSEPAIRGSYGIYAKSQAERLLGYHEMRNGTRPITDGRVIPTDDKIRKMGRHAHRLLLQGTQLLQTGEMDVNVGDKRADIFAMGDLAFEKPEDFYAMHLMAMAAFDQVQTPLPMFPNRERVNELLLNIRYSVQENA